MRQLFFIFIRINTLSQARDDEVMIKPDYATTHILISDDNGRIVSATGPGDSYPQTKVDLSLS